MSFRKRTVLVVDDEAALLNFVCRNLEVRDYHTRAAKNGLEALAIFENESIDLVILDLMMPHMDGLETILRIRKMSYLPIIVLSALGEEEDKTKALKMGADDYLTKPFGVEELLARIQAVLRRSQWMQRPERTVSRLVYGDLVVDVEQHQVFMNNEMVELTPVEFELLVFLMENAGKALTHRAILRNVWGEEYGQEIEYLRVYVGRLRQKVEADPANPRYLLTKRGIGYMFSP